MNELPPRLHLSLTPFFEKGSEHKLRHTRTETCSDPTKQQTVSDPSRGVFGTRDGIQYCVSVFTILA